MIDYKILVVDDFATMRRIIRDQLKEMGYSLIDEAEDGAEALAKLKSEHFDFAILDERLPDMDVWMLIEQIYTNRLLPNLAILVVLAEASKEKTALLDKLGAGGYIVKPFTRTTLQEKMVKILQRIAAKA